MRNWQAEDTEGETWEIFSVLLAQGGGGHQGPAIQLHSSPWSKSKINRSKRAEKLRQKGRQDNRS